MNRFNIPNLITPPTISSFRFPSSQPRRPKAAIRGNLSFTWNVVKETVASLGTG
jgi:hypothetical protein